MLFRSMPFPITPTQFTVLTIVLALVLKILPLINLILGQVLFEDELFGSSSKPLILDIVYYKVTDVCQRTVIVYCCYCIFYAHDYT